MKNFAVLEHDMQAKKHAHLQDIAAVGPEEARAKFLKTASWKPRGEHVVLVVKFLGRRNKQAAN